MQYLSLLSSWVSECVFKSTVWLLPIHSTFSAFASSVNSSFHLEADCSSCTCIRGAMHQEKIYVRMYVTNTSTYILRALINHKIVNWSIRGVAHGIRTFMYQAFLIYKL